MHIPTDYISEILKRLKLCADIQVSVDDFNYRVNLMNVKNGALEYRTGKLLSKNRNYKFTYRLNVNYLADANIEDAPNFKKFCETSLQGDTQKIELLLQFIGYIFHITHIFHKYIFFTRS